MAACISEAMTNHHREPHPGALAALMALLRVWRQRSIARSELARLTDRDFHDVGASWSDYAYEASKPFWRA